MRTTPIQPSFLKNFIENSSVVSDGLDATAEITISIGQPWRWHDYSAL
jgi:hypothetical protein